jgi:valyl-tRNA synthetase
VRDEQGRKMSKTIGNVVDPLTVMDEYGTDALRFTLLTGATPGNDMNLSISRVASNRNFANKIWNAARFVISHLETWHTWPREPLIEIEDDLPSRWIRSRLHRTIADVTRLMDDYQFGQAGTLAYDFLWGEYCDWYLEMSKLVLAGDDIAARQNTLATLVTVLDQALRLLHPFVPFVSEAVWQHLKNAGGEFTELWPKALIIADWPEGGDPDEDAEARINLLIDMVRAIRNARTENKVEAGRKIAATIVVGALQEELVPYADIVARLANVDEEKLFFESELSEKPANSQALVVPGAEIYLALEGMIDLDKERMRIEKEIEQTEGEIVKTEKLLSGNFASRAPAAVVEKERAKLADAQARREKLVERLKSLL